MKRTSQVGDTKWLVTATVVGGVSFGEIEASSGEKAAEKVERSGLEINLCKKCVKLIESPQVQPLSYVATQVGGTEVYRAGEPPTVSAAMGLLQHIWDNRQEATGHSWTRLNQAMSNGVTLAIQAGLFFDRTDFGLMHKKFNGGYWFGESGGEGWYSTAIEYSNESACQALEQWFGRKPIIFDGRRLHVGTRLWWPERDIRNGNVTSFKDDKESVIVCLYEVDKEKMSTSNKPSKRITIHRDEFVARETQRKNTKALDNDMRSIRQRLLRMAPCRQFPAQVTDEMLEAISKWPATKRKSVKNWCDNYWSLPMPEHLKQLLPAEARAQLVKNEAA